MPPATFYMFPILDLHENVIAIFAFMSGMLRVATIQHCLSQRESSISSHLINDEYLNKLDLT